MSDKPATVVQLGDRDGDRAGPRVLAWAFLSVAFAAVVVHALNGALSGEPGLHHPVADWLYLSLFAATAAACAVRAGREWRGGGRPLPWLIASLGVATWTAAEASFRLLEADPTASYPRFTQGLLVLSFGLATVTLVLLSRQRIQGISKGLALDGLIAGLAVAAVAAIFLFPDGPIDAAIRQPGPPTAFLLVDLAILAFVVVATALTGWRPGWCWGLMGAGIVVNLLGNIALVDATGTGDFQRGGLADTLYVSSALLLGLATFHPIRPAVRRAADDARGVFVPLLFAVLALGLLGYASLRPVGALPALLAVTTLVLILVRTGLAFRDNRRLLEAREHDSLTDGLTTLPNRRALMRELDAALAEAAEGRPVTLVLFDLDGFKTYNDTFGHPAGDALLARLGINLREAVAPHGAAFRMGGDEFCALLRGDGLKVEAVIAGACEALSESGGAFEVSPSFGAVALGHEAGTASEALQLGDQRMYGQKRGRSGSVAGQTRKLLLSLLKEREPDLDAHLHAVAGLARAVAAELGIEGEQLDVLVRAAELHDVGKVALPDAILHKPGHLDEQEWEIMHRHTVIGERILNSVPALAPVARVVRATHERVDGRGYPDGLSGEEIPLSARIISVCDAYNAIRGERPYDRARPHEDALEEIRACAGTQFDPVVVEAFCRAVELVEAAAPAASAAAESR